MHLIQEINQHFKDYPSLLDKGYSNIHSKAIVSFDTPLNQKEMDYFNSSICKLFSLFDKHKSLLSDEDFQYEVYYHVKELFDLEKCFEISKNKQIHSLINDFHSEFNFSQISNEQIVFLMFYLYFDKSGNIRKLELEAKDGHVTFEHSSMVTFTPRIRDRLSLLISLFFDKNNDLFNGIDLGNKVIINRDYLILLDCNSIQREAEIYSYLISPKRSISFDNISWLNLSKVNDSEVLNNYFKEICIFLNKDIDYSESKKEFSTYNYFFSKEDKKLLHNHPENKMNKLVNLAEKSSLRYPFSVVKFQKFFNDVKRAKDLHEILNNIDIEYNTEKNLIRKKGKI